ncbi:hypothetical protein Ahy_A04g020753 [Arachis hypogaea]|uniref:Aminotransferase-like plant mobile domain-containing protein n=1 Tax=Arachis hypogaea TaxID=3818 RepID=A0A445DIE4_ARAHY|nr:hypothetical protein Ahy_A04g020753 [Arachis hypogaea]
MIGILLLDIAAITRLPISPPDFTSDMQPRQQYNIAPTTFYSDFIVQHLGAKDSHVTDDDHVAILFHWLNAIIFCSRSVQMQKLFLPLVALLHEGNNLNLAKLLLGHIFEELGQFVNYLRNNYLIEAQSDEGRFWAVFSLFHSCKDFHNEDLNFTPFLCRNCGLAWLKRLLFPNDTEESELAKRSWANLLAV